MAAVKGKRQETTPSAEGPVLVAVDFSPDSEAAFLWACRYAKTAGLPIQVVHVVHDPAEAPGYYRRSERDALLPMKEVAAEMMVEFLRRMREQHAVVNDVADLDSVQVTGLPATRIIEVAERSKAQLIVMGCRGNTGFKRLLIGSKAERVVQLSPIAVAVIKSDKT